MPDYKTTPLYGGAILCDLPTKFADVSDIRQVPDNQEVWIDKQGFTSVIFEITERVGGPGSSPEIDGRALTEHLEDMVGDDVDTVKIWNSAETQFSRLDPNIPACTLIGTQTPHLKDTAATASHHQKDQQQRSSSAPDFTALIMTLLRLEKQKTDILITINVPHIGGEYDEDDIDLALGKQGKLIGSAVEYASRIWETLDVKDWGLFDA